MDNPSHSEQKKLAGAQAELWVGTYCGQDEHAIIRLSFDGDGQFTQTAAVTGVERPSFLAVSKSGQTLYAVEERGGGDGHVISLTSQPDTGEWTVGKRLSTEGGAPCHLALDDNERFLFVANYSGGSVLSYSLEEKGGLSATLNKVQHEGVGVRPDRQEGPHPHSVNWDARTGLLLVPDLGLDVVAAYRLDAGSGRLTRQSSLPFAPGAGPRHYTAHPTLPVAYVINELDSTVTVLRRTLPDGGFTVAESVSTLPTEGPQPDFNAPADLHLSADGAFLYGSNRGHDSIAVFAVDQDDGRLAPVQHIPTGGKFPRNFCLSPDGRYLLVANQDSDNIVVFAIDRTSGKLTPTGEEYAVKTPVCLVWAPASGNASR
jgi:6-phosphogluconolactonase